MEIAASLYTHRVEWTERVSALGLRGAAVTKGFRTTPDAVELHSANLARRHAAGEIESFSVVAL